MYTCDTCDKVMVTEAILEIIKGQFMKDLDFVVLSVTISNKTTKSSLLKAHIQSTHEGLHHKCDYCDHQSKTKATLRKLLGLSMRSQNIPVKNVISSLHTLLL